MRIVRRVLLTAATATAWVVAAGGWCWYQINVEPAAVPGGALVSISSGQPFAKTAQQLEAAGVVRSALVLRLLAHWTGSDRQVHSGDFRFDKPLRVTDVLEVLGKRGNGLHKVTIPEGSTLRDIADLLRAAGFGGSDQFLCLTSDPRFLESLDLPGSGAEGYLFPDTYSFSWSVAPAEILQAMTARFRENVAGLEARRRQSGLRLSELVTLASIVEKETGSRLERNLVSAVFYNRLRLGMRLQADPTAVYGRESGTIPSAADLDMESPYNTYLHAGLPPGPICSPGLAALEAALSPANVDYLYFVARGDGMHAFASNLDEHNRNVARLRHGR
ncbi:MAG: endolytic transglycosylase MltG [Deltaproteobacteria bacterium]|nr:endolytic transglycosylase MltG [Deltaproteobacteria bacterium]